PSGKVARGEGGPALAEAGSRSHFAHLSGGRVVQSRYLQYDKKDTKKVPGLSTPRCPGIYLFIIKNKQVFELKVKYIAHYVLS
uniref:Uncharacterized protein n=1 Tax=Malurus cyaneus samueli TaxID=2593467 RepID=A0A8C5TCW9_9PASS